MRSWRPDRSDVLLALGLVFTAIWAVLELVGRHPGYGLLGPATTLLAASSAVNRNDRSRRERKRRKPPPPRRKEDDA